MIARDVIQQRQPGFQPRVGVILGSGLGGPGGLADQLNQTASISYDELPGFPKAGVSGHQGVLRLAHAGGTPVALLQGRAHLYEDGRADAMAIPVRTLAELGCEALVVTNAAGGLDDDMQPGSIMLMTDHINFTGQSPLFGSLGDDRFVDMSAAYDVELRQRILALAKGMDVDLHQGVYGWFAGPNFETPAEVRAAGILGANAVGMSTVPEVILARHAGLRVAGLSIITNRAAGLSDTPLSHAQTKTNAALATDNVQRLLTAFLTGYGT